MTFLTVAQHEAILMLKRNESPQTLEQLRLRSVTLKSLLRGGYVEIHHIDRDVSPSAGIYYQLTSKGAQVSA
mgnify:CR=1 FL=1